MGVIRAVLNSLFFLRKDFTHTKSTKHKALQANSKGMVVLLLPCIRIKSSLLVPFKKLNCLDDLICITTFSKKT